MSLWNSEEGKITKKIDEIMVSRPKNFDIEDFRMMTGLLLGNYEKFFDDIGWNNKNIMERSLEARRYPSILLLDENEEKEYLVWPTGCATLDLYCFEGEDPDPVFLDYLHSAQHVIDHLGFWSGVILVEPPCPHFANENGIKQAAFLGYVLHPNGNLCFALSLFFSSSTSSDAFLDILI